MNQKLVLSLEVPEQNLLDALTTAVEGGISYWVNNEEDFNKVSLERDADLNVTKLVFYGRGNVNDDDNKRYEIVPSDLVGAAQKILSREPKCEVSGSITGQIATLASKDFCDIDAWGADVLVQVAAFGEVVFG
jgi:hypothetical protein